MRGVPDVDATADRLRWVADHRDEARDLGRQASAWAHRERNVWDKGPAVLEVMERRMGRRRPLRRLRTLWPVDRGDRCVRTSTRSPRDWTACGWSPTPPDDRGRAAAARPAPRRPGRRCAVHVARIVETALARVPVVVTEHAVVARIGPWERDATALVATTNADAQALRAAVAGQVGRVDPLRVPARRAHPGADGTAAGRRDRREAPGGRERRAASVAVASCCSRPASARSSSWRACWRGIAISSCSRMRRRARLDLGAALASGVPVLAAPDPRLADLDGAILQTADIAEDIARALTDVDLRQELGARAREHCHDHSWDRVAQRHLALWTALEAT